MNPKNPFPHYLNSAQGKLVNNLRFKITKTLKEFNRRGYRYKAKLELDYCRPVICGDKKIIFYRVTVIDIRAENEDDKEVASISFVYNITEDVKDFNYVIADKPRVKLEEVLDALFLAAHIAVEFYKEG
jgi:hypothetical protein